MADRNLDKEFDALRADFGMLRDDIAALAKAAGKKGGKAVNEQAARLGELADDALDYGREGVNVLEQRIAAQPLSSLLIAFGAGVLLSKLVGSRH